MIWKRIVLALVLAFAAIQLVPYGRSHSNPPVTAPTAWDSPRTEDLARRACYDCHSHETRWPWYASIAPVSWTIQKDVDEGRHKLNFSASCSGEKEKGEAAEEVQKGEMPPANYRLAHPEARLTAAEQQELIRGLTATFGGEAELRATSGDAARVAGRGERRAEESEGSEASEREKQKSEER